MTRPHSRLPVRPSHTAPPLFATSSTPHLQPRLANWDNSITVPFSNANHHIPLLAPQPQLPGIDHCYLEANVAIQVQQGNGQQTFIQTPGVLDNDKSHREEYILGCFTSIILLRNRHRQGIFLGQFTLHSLFR